MELIKMNISASSEHHSYLPVGNYEAKEKYNRITKDEKDKGEIFGTVAPYNVY